MFRRFSANFAIFSILLDAMMIALALYVSSYLRVDISVLPVVQEVGEPVRLPWILYLVLPGLWVGILVLFSVYDGRKNLRVVDELGSLTLGSILATISMAGILYLTFRDISRFLFIFFAVEAYMMLVLWRLTVRMYFRLRHWDSQRRNVLILGAGSVGCKLQDQVINQPHFGLKFIGFLDDDVKKMKKEPDILGTLDTVRSNIQQYQVDDVIIALPRSAYARLNQVVSELHDLPVRVWVIPDYFSLTLHRASVEEMAGIPMLDLRAPALSEYQRMMKRVFDLVISLPLLITLLPFLGIIAVAIRLDSRGQILYCPERVGENGRLFKMYKFRTMVVNADQLRHLVEREDENGRVIHKTPDDPRITRIGRLLRHASLDELPQVINVLKGDMSMVGPRPEMPQLVEKYELWQRKRFAVPQGMTGWWQIHGRSDKPMHLHTEEDLYYVQHYSIWLDVQILIRTLWVVLRGKGAY
jgi:exopolysaccharide biosynthesis polyprenyl glycosylphosphotransferase